MFGGSYFGEAYFGPTYWGPGTLTVPGGGRVKKRRKLSDAEIQGLRNIYPEHEILPEIEYEVTEQTIETPERVEVVLDVSALEAAQIQFNRVLTLTTEQKRFVLQETEDIGLILAIIESLED